jgi:outer membrane protein, heavy metal efflux system
MDTIMSWLFIPISFLIFMIVQPSFGTSQIADGAGLSVTSDFTSATVSNESELVVFFRQQNPEFQKLQTELLLAAAEAKKTRAFRNPEVSYEREQLYPDDGNASEDVIALSFPVDLMGKQRLMRKAAKTKLSSEEERIAWEMRFLEAGFRELFYKLLWAQRHHRALKEQATQFLSVLESVRSRHVDIKEYDRIRLEKEYAEADSNYKEFVLKVHALKSELIRWLGQEIDHDGFQAQGKLLPERSLPNKAALMKYVPDHPRVLSALHASQAQEMEKRAARRRWLPEFQLTGGYKQERAAGELDSGFVGGVSMPLPIFNWGGADVKQAEAVEEISLHELENVKNEVTMSLDESYEDYEGLRTIIREYERSAVSYADQLKQMAGVSYLEGKLTVLELIDAYETYTNTQLRLLALSLEARLSSIAMDLAVGDQLKN